ncbi:S8 family serine peptidase [Flammeovirgaceae bacterium SG7u.111]|nr:S8 family serine peptidase [Flammeovirgaceae bacterium SG7u.132]WPO37454.1 S8 family serine peptidase [Flammeovirgaceae bacterium SG7u.111]
MRLDEVKNSVGIYKQMRGILLLIMLIAPTLLAAQKGTYLISFTDKLSSPFSITQPNEFLSEKALQRRAKQGIEIDESDLPVNSSYIDGLKRQGAEILYTSKWLNAAVIKSEQSALADILALPFVTITNLSSGTLSPQSDDEEFVPATDYGRSFRQLSILDIDLMHTVGFRGEGIDIAVFDGGFMGADTIPAFQHLNILSVYDFVGRDHEIFAHSDHGTLVLSTLASQFPNQLIGSAYNANYHLLRTENSSTEERLEEFCWLVAAEYADSAGVDIINSSVSYSDFASPIDSYEQSQMDGKTTLVTQAANWAFSKGMFIVASVGNEGQNGDLPSIGAPADSPSVLAVGSIRFDGLISPFSSQGPSADGRIKPDVVALGNGTVVSRSNGSVSTANGTSYSAPLVTGLVAGIWQALPQLSNAELLELIRKSASDYDRPDNIYGYGIPSFEYFLNNYNLLDEAYFEGVQFGLYPNPFSNKFTLYSDKFLPEEHVRLTLFGLSGKVVVEMNNEWENFQSSFQIKNLQNGLYIGKFSTSKHQVVFKIRKLN